MTRMHVNNNQKAFFSLVRAGLWEHEAQPSPFSELDYNEIYRVAEEQSVMGLVTAGLEMVQDVKVPQEVLLTFIGSTLQLEQKNKAMNQFIGRLLKKLRDAGIYSLLIKGQGISQCYEKSLWRACGDVDLFLSDDNYKKAKEYLTPITASIEKEYEREKHLGMTIDGWVVELHGRLYSGLSSRIEKELDDVYRNTFYSGSVRSTNIGGVQVFMLSVENDVFYVFTHILQHFYKGGIGLRQICDWCRLLYCYRDKLNQRILESRIRKAGLMSEWKAFGAFAVEYLGMPVEILPFYSDGSQWKRKAKRICKFVMMSGNFGHNRDSYYRKYPYLVRKAFSFGRKVGDLCRHARIFPIDSLRFLPAITINGIRSAAKGE